MALPQKPSKGEKTVVPEDLFVQPVNDFFLLLIETKKLFLYRMGHYFLAGGYLSKVFVKNDL